MMVSKSGYPKGWSKYLAAQKAKGKNPSKDLANFAARYRTATKFSGVNLDGMSQAAEMGYFLGLKLTLVESAIESLERATGIPVGSIKIIDSDVAYDLWEARQSELKTFLDLLENEKLKVSLRVFISSNSDEAQHFNLRTILRGFRHITAHGGFTPTAAGVYSSKKYHSLLLRLAESSLESCEEEFYNRL